MINHKITLYTLLIWMAFWSAHSLKAQSLTIYKGPYQTLTGLKGKAEFEFFEKGKNRIKNGKFHFEMSEADSLSFGRYKHVVWDGYYTNNQKDKAWRYQKIEHEFDLLEISDFEPKYELFSYSTNLSAGFNAGVPDGPWKYEQYKMDKGDTTNNRYVVSTNFDQGKINGPFTVTSSIEGSGIISAEGEAKGGLMEGLWVLKYRHKRDTILEKREYLHGILTSLIKIGSGGDTIAYLKYPHSPKLEQYLENRPRESDLIDLPLSLQFSDGYPRNSDYILAQQQANHYLQSSVNQILENEYDFLHTYGLPLGTNRMYYPLSPNESEAIEGWSETEYGYRKHLQALDELGVSDFLFIGNDTLGFIHEWRKAQGKLLDYITPWNNIILNNELHYYYREGLLATYVNDFLIYDSIQGSGLVDHVLYSPPASGQGSFVFFLLQNIQERQEYADSLGQLAKGIIARQVQKDEIALKTTALYEEYKKVRALYENRTSDEGVNHLLAKINDKFIEDAFKKEYKRIADNGEDPTIKARRLDTLARNIALTKEVYEIMSTVPNMMDTLDELYTVYKFDPYTFSENVPIRLHRRLYEHVAEDLVSRLMTLAKESDRIVEVHGWVDLIRKTQSRMEALIRMEEELEVLNKKVKRNLSVGKTLELLKI